MWSFIAKNQLNHDPQRSICAKICQEAYDMCKIALSKPLSIVEQQSLFEKLKEVEDVEMSTQKIYALIFINSWQY